jgi:hypothetical protein
MRTRTRTRSKTGFIGVVGAELVDEIRRIVKIAGGLPRIVGCGIVLPANFVKEITTAES